MDGSKPPERQYIDIYINMATKLSLKLLRIVNPLVERFIFHMEWTNSKRSTYKKQIHNYELACRLRFNSTIGNERNAVRH